MSFRSLDLAKYHLDLLHLQFPLTEDGAREVLAVIDGENEEIHFHGYHPYTISGTSYWAYLHLFRVSEDPDYPYAFEVGLHRGEPNENQGEKVIRRIATEMIQTAGARSPEKLSLGIAKFQFPTEDYGTPLLPSAPPFDPDEVTSDVPDAYQLWPSGIRYSSDEGVLDVILDTSGGRVSLSIQRAVEGDISMESIREVIKEFHEYAELFVEPKTGDDDDED